MKTNFLKKIILIILVSLSITSCDRKNKQADFYMQPLREFAEKERKILVTLQNKDSVKDHKEYENMGQIIEDNKSGMEFYSIREDAYKVFPTSNDLEIYHYESEIQLLSLMYLGLISKYIENNNKIPEKKDLDILFSNALSVSNIDLGRDMFINSPGFRDSKYTTEYAYSIMMREIEKNKKYFKQI